jgi:hypothetical protein
MYTGRLPIRLDENVIVAGSIAASAHWGRATTWLSQNMHAVCLALLARRSASRPLRENRVARLFRALATSLDRFA